MISMYSYGNLRLKCLEKNLKKKRNIIRISKKSLKVHVVFIDMRNANMHLSDKNDET